MAIGKRPAILIVHGSWHRPARFESLVNSLKQIGFETVCPPLPSVGKGRLGKTWEDDVSCIRDAALRLFDQGKQVVLVAHSYGGVPASPATEGLTRSERAAAGFSGGFCHVVYMAAFAVPVRGMSVVQAIGGSFQDWIEHDEMYGESKNRSTFVNEKARAVLYSDVSAEQADWAMSRLQPQSQLAPEDSITFAASDVAIPKTFIVCEKDLAMPVDVQEALTAGVPGMMRERVGAGHSPFLSKPYECAQLIARITQTGC